MLLDASRIEEPPVAVIDMPQRIELIVLLACKHELARVASIQTPQARRDQNIVRKNRQ
ncbi:hypothetical protein D3C86_1724850 [compost metagenome]